MSVMPVSAARAPAGFDGLTAWAQAGMPALNTVPDNTSDRDALHGDTNKQQIRAQCMPGWVALPICVAFM